MMKALTTLSLALIACGQETVETKPAKAPSVITYANTDLKTRATPAMAKMLQELELQTGLTTAGVDFKVETVLGPTDCNGANGNAAGCTKLKETPVRVILTQTSVCFADTMMMHELGHVALYAETGDADHNHSDKVFWSTVERVMSEIQHEFCK